MLPRHKHLAIADERRPPATNTEIFLIFNGYPLCVRGDYQPFEPPIIDSINSMGCPGCPEDFEPTEIYLADSAIDIAELDIFDIDALRVAVLEKIQSDAAATREDLAA